MEVGAEETGASAARAAATMSASRAFEDLEKATKEVIRARGWGRFMKDGFVPVPCDS